MTFQDWYLTETKKDREGFLESKRDAHKILGLSPASLYTFVFGCRPTPLPVQQYFNKLSGCTLDYPVHETNYQSTMNFKYWFLIENKFEEAILMQQEICKKLQLQDVEFNAILDGRHPAPEPFKKFFNTKAGYPLIYPALASLKPWKKHEAIA